MVTQAGRHAGGEPAGRARIGILSVQGAFAAHAAVLRELGAAPVAVLAPPDLQGLDGLVLPGGESTTMSLLAKSNGLWEELARFLASGRPVLGTCAGAILAASEILDGRPDQQPLRAVDISVRRNGFGRQVDSFEADLAWPGGPPLPAVFIRAPVIERAGAGVEVIASLSAPRPRTPVLCRQGSIVLATFHPELTGDRRVHRLAFGPVLAGGPDGRAPSWRPGDRAAPGLRA